MPICAFHAESAVIPTDLPWVPNLLIAVAPSPSTLVLVLVGLGVTSLVRFSVLGIELGTCLGPCKVPTPSRY